MEPVVFELNFYDIAEKNNVNTYINDIQRRLDLLKIKCEIVPKTEGLDEKVTPSVSKISEMDGGDESIMNSLLSSIDSSSKTTTPTAFKYKIVLFELLIYEDNLEKTRYFGIQQLNSWLFRRENEKNIVPSV